MKKIQYIIILTSICLASCHKTIDLYPESNLSTATYYTSDAEVKAGLTACYNGLQLPMFREWQFTELRSDNTYMGVTGSTNSFNRELSDLDWFVPATSLDAIYQYWLSTYFNIRNCNILLDKLGVNYNPASGTISLSNIDIPISDVNRKQYAGEALFIRAYHYFNLVRLFGGVFLVHTPISPLEAKSINRSSVADTYKFIESDLTTASTYMSNKPFSQIAAADRGRTTSWAAKALLGKVYLTQNKKTEAITQLNDVRLNSGFGLQSTYASVFAVNNEVNSEILFTIRYKAGGLGLGSSFGNDFAPLASSGIVIFGTVRGWNTPSSSIDTFYNAYASDARKAVNVGRFLPSPTVTSLYVKKFTNQVTIDLDGESDWPVLRYADVLLMLAEAQGNTGTSVGYISQVRTRSGLPSISGAFPTLAEFEKELTDQRRAEFAFENHRWFDLVRFGSTLTTINPVQILKDHFAYEYASHYSTYVAPVPTLAQLQGYVTTQKLLLPIPQREIDLNTQIMIAQNPGY